MSISKETLKGYILEEVLAYLIRGAGYKLLVHPDQDPQELKKFRNNLWVRGRGGIHQVDVLGQLEWIPAFTFPLRLFIEAKFRRGTMGIDVVRNAIGTILDINQNNLPTPDQIAVLQKYHYAYALFSTSGFSEGAVKMALAHQTSLIDLSGNEFNDLRNVIDSAASTIASHRYITIEGEEEHLNDTNNHIRRKLVLSLRYILRDSLGTLPPIDIPLEDRPQINNNYVYQIREALEPIMPVLNRYNELFVAMTNGPYMLLLKADNPTAFLSYATEHPQHMVKITWSSQIDNGTTWIINPVNDTNIYRLSFRLPKALSDWIFKASNNARERALKVKTQFFSTITIYRHTANGQDHLFRLNFNPESIRRNIESESGG